MEIIYKRLDTYDVSYLTALLKLYEDVFEMPPYPRPEEGYLQKLLNSETPFFYVALQNNIVVGGLTAHLLPSLYYPPGEVYIYDLAVKTNMQRKGIGKNLIEELKIHTAAIGYNEIFVQADLVDKHALDFYKATGGTAESVVHFTYGL
jgi:aminoglycoside 3-N-acetyltransferase I